MKLHKNDKVVVLAGRDKGKEGAVLKVIPADSRVIVEGVNIAKRHTKPGGKNPRGGIIEITKPILAGKVALVCPHCKKPTRVGYEIKEDTKTRICRKCGQAVK
jgi:large subunit ribosomal protein L24